MRKVGEQIGNALANFKRLTVGNTYTEAGRVWLHGNLIAEIKGGRLYTSLAGWNTVTTRSRLNDLIEIIAPHESPRPYSQKNFEPRYNGCLIDDCEWISRRI